MSSPAITIGPRVRKSPFYDATIEAGAKAFTIYNHMFMPTSYGDTTAEYWAIVKGVSLWDVAAERQVEIIGPDAIALTQLLTPRDIDKCPINRARYVVFVDEDSASLTTRCSIATPRTTSGCHRAMATCCSGPKAWPHKVDST